MINIKQNSNSTLSYQTKNTTQIGINTDSYNRNNILSSDNYKNKVATSSQKVLGFWGNVFNNIRSVFGVSQFTSNAKNQFSIIDSNKDNIIPQFQIQLG
ncbi:MAG: hypothetical protein U0457_08055 [Candidatus Sericytochromatia bacterium]